jgi:hypothetical protein
MFCLHLNANPHNDWNRRNGWCKLPSVFAAEASKPGLCLYAVSPFSDRIYGTITVYIRYGYGTVRSKTV